MSRRHDNLIPLSHQHQHALTLAVTIRRRFGLEKGEKVWRDHILAWIQRAYRTELIGHFTVEETLLFPGVVAHPDFSTFDALSAMLENHIHKKERQLFPLLEQKIPAEEATRFGAEIRMRLRELCPTEQRQATPDQQT